MGRGRRQPGEIHQVAGTQIRKMGAFMKERDSAIDVLKFFAVLCVINSHMDVCYPGRWSVLASGGAIGDALFFFCSGHTLFLGRMDGFVPWMKRRLWRVLPATLLCVGVFALWYGGGWWSHSGGYWFIRCILIYYVAIYAIRKWLMDRLGLVFGVLCAAILIWFYGCYDQRIGIYSGHYIMWLHYFVPMLMGACLGMRNDHSPKNGFLYLPLLIASIVIYFAGCFLTRTYVAFQPLTLPFLWANMYFGCMAAKCTTVNRLFAIGFVRWGVMAVGGLCLEVYLSHRPFLTDALNGCFPLNVPLLFVAMLLLAYVVRCMTRFIVQSLQWQGRYDWQAIVKV